MATFGIDETHGILKRPGNEFVAVSDRLAWSSVFASIQRERPYEDSFAARPDHLIILHLDGFVKVDRWVGVSRESRMIPPGGTFMVPGGMDFRVRLGDSLSTMHFYLRQSVLDEVARDIWQGDPDRLELIPRIGESDPLIERIILDLREELLDPGAGGETYVDYLARAAAARLIKAHSVHGRERARPIPASLTGDGRRKVAEATDYVHAHLHRSIRLEELAAAVGLTVPQLTVLFKRTLRQPPHRFVTNLRVTRAREMLVTTSLPITEIALACGFSHQEHMTRIFKRETGLTPAVYRRDAG